MKKYNVVNYVRWKNDVVESIRAIPQELREQAVIITYLLI